MKRIPSILSVNFLYLISAGLLITIGTVLQLVLKIWGLIISEVVTILLPAVLFLVILKYPFRETVRWRWPGTAEAGLIALAGVGLSLVASWLSVVVVSILGYSIYFGPEFYPLDWGSFVVQLIAMAIAAPFCEEILFRGVIQRSYERFKPWVAIVLVGVMFMLFHLSFLRLWALVPVALALGFVAWRTQSVIGSIILHAVYNGILTFVGGSMVWGPQVNLEFLSSPIVGMVGLLISGGALWLLNRKARPVTAEPVEPAAPPEVVSAPEEVVLQPVPAAPVKTDKGMVVLAVTPLVIFGFVFAFFAGIEVLMGTSPEFLAMSRVSFHKSQWTAPAHLTYELRNAGDEKIGEAVCDITPEGETVRLACSLDQKAYELQKGRSFFKDGSYQREVVTLWDAGTMRVMEAHSEQTGDIPLTADVHLTEDEKLQLDVTGANGAEPPAQASKDALFEYEWPWRFSALRFMANSVHRSTELLTSHWSEEAEQSLPAAQPGTVWIQGAEPILRDSGYQLTWRVAVDDQTAWYDINEPYLLVRYDDGMTRWELIKAE